MAGAEAEAAAVAEVLEAEEVTVEAQMVTVEAEMVTVVAEMVTVVAEEVTVAVAGVDTVAVVAAATRLRPTASGTSPVIFATPASRRGTSPATAPMEKTDQPARGWGWL